MKTDPECYACGYSLVGHAYPNCRCPECGAEQGSARDWYERSRALAWACRSPGQLARVAELRDVWTPCRRIIVYLIIPSLALMVFALLLNSIQVTRTYRPYFGNPSGAVRSRAFSITLYPRLLRRQYRPVSVQYSLKPPKMGVLERRILALWARPFAVVGVHFLSGFVVILVLLPRLSTNRVLSTLRLSAELLSGCVALLVAVGVMLTLRAGDEMLWHGQTVSLQGGVVATAVGCLVWLVVELASLWRGVALLLRIHRGLTRKRSSWLGLKGCTTLVGLWGVGNALLGVAVGDLLFLDCMIWGRPFPSW
jgi:predicted RNA-binding Zn-ribbon protein involved in translation (DUF1610 family)